MAGMAMPTISSQTQAITADPTGDQQKLNFLSEYMVRDCGCRTPEQVLAMMERLDRDGSSRAPHTLVQRLYAAAQKAKAYAAWKEAHPSIAP